MKFTIKVEMDKTNTIKKAVVIGVNGEGKEIQLKQSPEGYPPGGVSWLVFDEMKKKRMIVLSQLEY